MNGKILIALIGGFLLFIFAGIYFVLRATYIEVPEDNDEIIVKNNSENTKHKNHVHKFDSNVDVQNNENSTKHVKNQDIKNLAVNEKQVVVDQVLQSTSAKEEISAKDKKSKDKNANKTRLENEKLIEVDFKDLKKNHTSLEVSFHNKGRHSNDRSVLTLTDKRGKSVITAVFHKGKFLVNQILPGEYLLNFNYQGTSMQRTIEIFPKQKNVAEISVPGATLSLEVKNADGEIITNVMISLFSGEKYRHENSFLGNQMVTPGDGKGSYFVMPKVPYCIVIEEDFRFNYQVNVIGPFVLEPGENKKINYVLPYARKLPKIQIVDAIGNPIPDVGFNFSDENGNFFQRTLKKEWDLYPYSNQEGFLPERGWPIGNFTLIVGKDGFEYRETVIPIDYNANQLLQIKLNKSSSLTCSFPQTLIFPISVGVVNKAGDLIQKPIPVASHQKRELTVYFENITSGSVKFNDLAAGEYFIGYFWNGTNRLISKQGPIKLGVEEDINVTSTLVK